MPRNPRDPRLNRKKSNEFSLGAAIEAWIEQTKLEDGLRFERVRANWSHIVGPLIASRTEGIWMIEGVIYLRMKSPSWNHEVSFARDRIRHEINAYVNHPLCSDVRLR
jgi:hypothetical protein